MPTSTPNLSMASVATPMSGVPVYCPVCQTVPLHGKQTVCSSRCWIQPSVGRREATQTDDLNSGLYFDTNWELVL